MNVIIWDEYGLLRFYLYNGEPSPFPPPGCNDIVYCPSVKFLDVLSYCEPFPSDCGGQVFPPVEVSLGASVSGGSCTLALGQGEVAFYFDGTEQCLFTGKVMVAKAYKLVENYCLDYPYSWIGALAFNNTKVSQCVCKDNNDCAYGFVCDTVAKRCVQNRCMDKTCPSGQGYECNPYNGECVQPLKEPYTKCGSNADCGDMQVCNHYWKQIYGFGVCEFNICTVADCFFELPNCSPFSDCYQCLSDCDCYTPGGVLDTGGGKCVDKKCMYE
ncbi:MAG: hypothetical protein FJ088_01925 [Deltaproteobacteria bacterium]|nr:hypothetical protein [Deltaproteobacteria bacterium]